MKSDLKTYGEYAIKEVNGIRQFNKDKTPILGEKITTKRLDAETVKILNRNVNPGSDVGFHKFYVLEEEKKNKPKDKSETNDGNGLEKLREKGKELGIKGYQIMKEETLTAKIKELEDK